MQKIDRSELAKTAIAGGTKSCCVTPSGSTVGYSTSVSTPAPSPAPAPAPVKVMYKL